MRNGGRARREAVALALVVLAACGGGGGGGELGLDDQDVFRLQPGDRPVRFRLDTAVSEEVKGFVVETLGWAHADLGDSGPLTVHVYSDAEHFVVAYTSEFAITAEEARGERPAARRCSSARAGTSGST